MRRVAGHGLIILVLTTLSLTGGLAWAAALAFRRRWLAFVLFYAALWLAAWTMAPMAGRVALPCTGGPLRSQSLIYCALNRHYVTPELYNAAQDLAHHMARTHPGTITLSLDAGFPFGRLPLLPHLSHNDGEKLDLALYYRDHKGHYLPGQTRSPIGYFAFQQGPDDCSGGLMRWDFAWLQRFFPDLQLDQSRMKTALEYLSKDPRIGKVFIEPHLRRDIGVRDAKLRFQGCHAARHDDHIHIQR
ncbi:hypothetical protein [Paracoccus jiaweipingae]|uniref:hypothetical protein n=1 Tax=unclassified Paracoccus (in: a-proteobacteria) TaxID=2688777 RepID=UPI00378D5AE3